MIDPVNISCSRVVFSKKGLKNIPILHYISASKLVSSYYFWVKPTPKFGSLKQTKNIIYFTHKCQVLLHKAFSRAARVEGGTPTFKNLTHDWMFMIGAGDQPWIIPGFGLEKLQAIEQTEGETETEAYLMTEEWRSGS